jgi:hypothetical protein
LAQFLTFSLDPKDLDRPVEGLTVTDLEILDEWVDKYQACYPCLGTLVDAPYFDGQKDR